MKNILANEKFRKEALSIFNCNLMGGPAEMPVKDKSDESYYSNESVNEDYPCDANKKTSLATEKVISNFTGNDSSKNQKLSNIGDTYNSKREISFGKSIIEDSKQIPKSCLHYQQELTQNEISSEAQNIKDINIHSHHYQKMNDGNLDDDKICVDVKNMNLYYRDLEAMSSRFKETTKYIHENVNRVYSNKEHLYKINPISDVHRKFVQWTETRRNEYNSRSSLYKPLAVIPIGTTAKIKQTTVTDKNFDKKVTCTHAFVTEANGKNKFENQHQNRNKNTLECECNQIQSFEQSLTPMYKDENRSIRPKVQSDSKKVYSNKACRKKIESSKSHDSSEPIFSGRNGSYLSAKLSTKLCIKITDEKCNKYFDFLADSVDVARMKKKLPKLSANIPDIDTFKEINYSADAINIVLRFVFCQSFNFVMPPANICVEVLATAQLWDINNSFFKLFEEKFLQNVLTSKNASAIFSQARLYNLKELCDRCEAISLDNVNTNVPKRKQKTCLVSISKYIEPSEINISFEPIKAEFSLSFLRQIRNKFTFKVISDHYSIIGFQVLLNKEYVIKKVENKNKLTIDYSLKNVNNNQRIVIYEREEKPFRSINCIYFKKHLIINPKEVGEIVIEIEIEPFLCSARKEQEIIVKDSVGELQLMMVSNRKIENSDRKIFFIGNFFYHVTKDLKNTKLN